MSITGAKEAARVAAVAAHAAWAVDAVAILLSGTRHAKALIEPSSVEIVHNTNGSSVLS